jgi:hypothetical protein
MSDLWRLRVVAVVAPAAIAAVAAATVLPAGREIPLSPTVVGASDTRCVATGALDSVAAVNRFASKVRGPGGEFQGGDVGTDVRLQDGRRLFLFGDTLRGEDFDGASFVRNSMMVVTPGCAQVVLPADHGALIPSRDDGVGYWPMSVAAVERPGYDVVGVATQRVGDLGDPSAGVFNFEILGPSMAVFLVPRGETPQLIGQVDLGPDSADPTRPVWGAAAAVVGEDVYLYGTSRPTEGSLGFALQVARVRLDDVLELSAYRYWDGTDWVADAGRAAVLIPADGGVSATLSVFRRGQTWYALSKQDEVLGTELAIWTAPAPTGPFTLGSTPAEIPSDAVSGTLRYMPLAHPDLLPKKGTVLVSYSQNNTDFAKVQDDPRLYRPRFLRVPLP